MAATTSAAQLRPDPLNALSAQFRGALITAADASYDDARMVYNAMIDKRPALIARCADVADVIHAVRFAREQDLPIAVRGGGHNVAGKGTCDDGLVIDLSQMKGVLVDPQGRTVRVEGGAVWGDVDHATNAFGLATPSGIISTTGVAGLTLGGGFGHLSRRYGLSLDNLLEADVVLADGGFVTAGENQHADLFWALRGGGGNFGIVTSFTFRLHEVETVYGGPIFFPAKQAALMLEFYRDWVVDAPRELSAFYAVHQAAPAPWVPEALHFHPAAAFMVCYTGPLDAAERAVRPFRELGGAVLDLMGPLPYPAIQTMFDDLFTTGLQHYWKSDVISALPDPAIQIHARRAPTVPDPWSGIHIYPLNGAIHEAQSDATAFPFRDALAAHNVLAVNPDPAVMDERIAWARGYYEELRPYAESGGYVNFMSDEGDERIRAAYRGNYARLARTKKQYDPDNVFHINQNIRPA
jgi:FAD/FMN-containing dehydrogenase